MERQAGPLTFLNQFRRKPLPLLFISFRGEELRNSFVSHVVRALKEAGFNVFIDSHEVRGRDIRFLLRRIENSKVALVIFSERFAESEWCLREVTKIAEQVRAGCLVAIPVFYRVSTNDVKMLQGKFGDCFVETLEKRVGVDHPLGPRWMNSVMFIAGMIGFTSEVHSIDDDLVEEIVKAIKRQLPYQSPASKALEREFTRELLSALIVSCICYYLIPSLFTDLNFFASPKWFLLVLMLFVIRKIIFYLES
ncbi:PREDICTED: vesicle-associated protein 1-4 [Camelina sativa]|uniref:Vesicle-associated protein 1-4 n=1 Tax=Camelina sativa TaxID=90675 RepID=A0ABM0UDP3_CAMSA|nr:PREDICTED: vesicle-associated protein 1-4 [Camelina sativa]